jgi:hypothetical protein
MKLKSVCLKRIDHTGTLFECPLFNFRLGIYAIGDYQSLWWHTFEPLLPL